MRRSGIGRESSASDRCLYFVFRKVETCGEPDLHSESP